MARRKDRKAGKGGVITEAGADTVVDELELEYEYEYEPTEADGDMFGGTPAKKAEHFWPSFNRLIGLLRTERLAMVWVTLLVVVSVALTVIAPKVLGNATDVIVNGVTGARQANGQPGPGPGIDFTELGRLLMIVLALYIAASLLQWWQGYILNALVMRVVYRLRAEIEDKLNRLPLSYFDTRQRGDLMSRVTNDVDNIQTALQQAFSQLIQSVLMVLGIGVMIVHRVVAARAHRAHQHPALRHHRRGDRHAFAEAVQTAVELHRRPQRAHRGVVLGSRPGARLRPRRGHARAVRRAQRQAVEVDGRRAVRLRDDYAGDELRLLPLLRADRRRRRVAGDREPAEHWRCDGVHPVLARVLPAHRQIAGMANMLQSGVASAERTFEFLDSDEQTPEHETEHLPERANGRVELDGVDFSYDPETELIRDLSLSVEPGHTVAIVGPTGAGKTTLVNLIMRFYELNGGTIRLDGIDTTELSRSELRGQVGMVLQDAWLFSGTIRENIRYGRLEASDEEVVAAAKATMVDRFVRQLPDGYDTVIEADGGNVSAGERQLLTIARAFIANPSLLILDEATSSVDTRTELLVQHAMAALRSDRTSFVIAHRLSTIRDAHTILVMEKGRIVEQDDHKTLLAKKGAYYDLYMTQFRGAAAESGQEEPGQRSGREEQPEGVAAS
ncbi:ABC transporter NBP/MSD fusion protein (pimaricin) [Leifsonia xyli subsp. cynodontis DSM 46306]|uniref:Fatty acid ABC transporter ATP-binding/permease protein n=1 Tax=Leifsonia xyli subsp. cynodontis DSM 46306 TaxID=1389489 RepID=U3P4R5_LEIXC|nr:ABC transporter NBP/MSD fusion protein (pimaricin) [Leifsonia xyli subsp. cynodontis DSM 46306]